MRQFVPILVFAGLLGAWGCDRQDPVTSYNAPKDETPAIPEQTAEPRAAVEDATPQWMLPAGWKQIGAQQSMRFATIAVNEDDPPVVLTVIPLGRGGAAGQVGPNVNRWEAEVGLPPTPEGELSKIVKHIDSNGLHLDTVDLVGPKPTEAGQAQRRMLAAMVPQGQRMWFFKLVGPAEKVGAQKENFEAFVRSITFGAAEPAVAGGPTQILGFTTPAGWQQDPPAAPPRMLSFAIGTGEQKAEVVVTRMEGVSFGSLEDNINRWRGQVGLGPTSDIQAYMPKKVMVGENEGAMFEVNGPESAGAAKKQLLSVLVSVENDKWFFKIIGPAAVVTEQRGAFETFLKSVKIGVKPAP